MTETEEKDHPAEDGHPAEEAAIEKASGRRERQLREIDVAVGRAWLRRAQYLAEGKTRDAEIQEDVYNRRLAERLGVTGK